MTIRSELKECPMSASRALLVINRNSRNGNCELDSALQIFSEHGIQMTTVYPDKPGDIAQLIANHAGQVDYVVIGGGDGTINAAASALLQHQLPLGILPMGTANDLARTLAIPGNLPEAAAIIANGVCRRIDIGVVNGVHFFNVANIGLGVQVKREMTAENKQRWGILSYAKALLSAFKKNHPFNAKIICDDKVHHVRSIQIAVGNGRYYGGGMTVEKNAAIDDHQFALYSLKPVSLWTLLRHSRALRAGYFDDIEPALLLNGRKISITTHKPMPITMDGEVRAQTPAIFTIIPQALQVFAPLPDPS